MKIYALYDCFGCEAGEETPHRDAKALGPKVPECVHNAADGHPVDAQGEPAQLMMLGESLGEEAWFVCEIRKVSADDEAT